MKIVCEACGNRGYLQHIGKNYYRIRHYAGLDSVSKKPRFEYHKQGLSYVQSLLRQNNPSPIDLIDPKTIDPNKPNTSSISSSKWTGGDLNPDLLSASQAFIPTELPAQPVRRSELLSRSNDI